MSQISRSLKVKKNINAQPKSAEVKAKAADKAPEAKLQNVENGNAPAPVLKKGTVKPKTSTKSRRSQSVDANKTVGQSQITDFFRRSSRKTEALSKNEQKAAMEKRILDGVEDGLVIEHFPEKGRGVVATRPFQRGEYVVEYYGELISVSEAKKREEEYSSDPTAGCYMLYFLFKGRRFCIDATSESGRLGRLVNHKRNGNCATKAVTFSDDSHAFVNVKGKNSGRCTPEERPRVVLVAARDISVGEEILYDYGDRNPESLAAHPWLAY